jgi:hypothetical protein
MMKKSFTLVELMVVVVIFTVGIISVLRSFLSVSNALVTGNNMFAALQYLDSKIADIEEDAIREKGVEEGEDEGEFVVEGHKFNWLLEIEELLEEDSEEEKEKKSKDEGEYILDEIFLKASWKQGNRERALSLSTYLEKREDLAKVRF